MLRLATSTGERRIERNAMSMLMRIEQNNVDVEISHVRPCPEKGMSFKYIYLWSVYVLKSPFYAEVLFWRAPARTLCSALFSLILVSVLSLLTWRFSAGWVGKTWLLDHEREQLRLSSHLPIPPSQKLINFLLLLGIIEQLQNRGVESFWVHDSISSGEYRRWRQCKTNLWV